MVDTNLKFINSHGLMDKQGIVVIIGFALGRCHCDCEPEKDVL